MESLTIDKFTSKSDSILKNIPVEIRQRIEKRMLIRTYRKGQNIFLEGSYPAGIFYLKEGMVKKYKTDNSGKEHILYLCSTGELLGYPALLCNEPYPDSASALEISRLGFISRELFLKFMNESNELMLTLLSSLSHEFSVMVNSVTVFARMTVRERLALILLILSAKFKKKNSSKPVEIILSRQDLANMVGTAPETLIRLLQVFRKDKVIDLKAKNIVILDPKELMAMSKFY